MQSMVRVLVHDSTLKGGLEPKSEQQNMPFWSARSSRDSITQVRPAQPKKRGGVGGGHRDPIGVVGNAGGVGDGAPLRARTNLRGRFENETGGKGRPGEGEALGGSRGGEADRHGQSIGSALVIGHDLLRRKTAIVDAELVDGASEPRIGGKERTG